MAEEAPPSERTALSLGLVVPSPVPMTESDEEEPQSAQVPEDGNSDNAEGAAIPIVQAVLVQTAARDDSETAVDPSSTTPLVTGASVSTLPPQTAGPVDSAS